jgi:hypothetical protein
MHADSRTALWEELLSPQISRLSPEAAKASIKLKRRQLLDLNRDGKLSPEQRGELEFFIQFGDFLGILQSTARLSLKQAVDKPRRKTA